MVEERQYKIQCPFCKNWMNVSDAIPNGTRLSFFSDFILENGKFKSSRCFASITGQTHRKKQKEEEIEFKENTDTKTLF